MDILDLKNKEFSSIIKKSAGKNRTKIVSLTKEAWGNGGAHKFCENFLDRWYAEEKKSIENTLFIPFSKE